MPPKKNPLSTVSLDALTRYYTQTGKTLEAVSDDILFNINSTGKFTVDVAGLSPEAAQAKIDAYVAVAEQHLGMKIPSKPSFSSRSLEYSVSFEFTPKLSSNSSLNELISSRMFKTPSNIPASKQLSNISKYGKLITNTEDAKKALSILSKQGLLGFDIETTGRSAVNSEIITIQLGNNKTGAYVFDVRSGKVDINIFKRILEDEKIRKVGHNIAFDISFVRKKGLSVKNFYDTMAGELVLRGTNKQYASLADLLKKYTGVELEKELRNAWLSLGDKAITKELANYAAADPLATIHVYEHQRRELLKKLLATKAMKEAALAEEIATGYINGLDINRDFLREVLYGQHKELKKKTFIPARKNLITGRTPTKGVVPNIGLGVYGEGAAKRELSPITVGNQRLDPQWPPTLSDATTRYKIYKKIEGIESASPFQMLRTFRISERMQTHVLTDMARKAVGEMRNNAHIPFDRLVKGKFLKTAVQFSNMGIDIPNAFLSQEGLLWAKSLGHSKFQSTGILLKVAGDGIFRVAGTDKFLTLAQSDTRLVGMNALRHGMLGAEGPEAISKAAAAAFDEKAGKLGFLFGRGGLLSNIKIGGKDLGTRWYEHHALRDIERLGSREPGLAPIHTVTAKSLAGAKAKFAGLKVRDAAMSGMMRFNRLLNEFGVGIRTSDFDRLATLPFHNVLAETKLGQKMGLTRGIRGGLINKLLTRRYLPAVAAIGAARYLDYSTNHVGSNLIVNAYAKGKEVWAKVTTPVRPLREMADQASPFPIWAPAVALPALGAVGGLLKAGNIARGGEEAIGNALGKLGIPNTFETLTKYVDKKGVFSPRDWSPAYRELRGALAKKYAKKGLMIAAPFALLSLIPKKSAEELRQIHTGEKEVPILKSRWWEFCLVSGSLVQTSRGVIQIEDVMPSDSILTHTAAEAEISDISSHYESITHKITTTSFIAEDIRTTPDHQLYAYKDSRLGWYYTKDLVCGDKLAYPLPQREVVFIPAAQYIDVSKPTLSTRDENKNTLFTRLQYTQSGTLADNGSTPVSIRQGCLWPSKELGLILGVYLGDGNVFREEGRGPRGVEFAFGPNEYEKAVEVNNAINNIFGISTIIQMKGNMYRLRYMSSVLGEIFDSLFSGCEKIIPGWMYRVKIDSFYKGLLSGLVDSDGYIINNRYIAFVNTNINIVHLFWQACLYLGVYTKVREKTSRLIEERGYKKAYGVYINSEMTRKFLGLVSFLKSCRIESQTEWISAHIATTVVDGNGVEYVLFDISSNDILEEKVLVHDICVEHEDHSFLGCSIAYHNSNTPYEGDRIKGYRKHWIARFLSRQKIKDEYGSEEEYWKRSLLTPRGWWNLLVDPYGKEKEAAKRGREFPLTEELFTDVPFIGKNIGRYVGRTIKPVKYFRDDYTPDKLVEMYKSENPRLEPSMELGGLKPKTPIDPGSFRNVVSQTSEEFLELSGLPGWMMKAFVAQPLTGKEFFMRPDQPLMQTANQVGSRSRWFYGLELGGGMFTTEPIRRLIPKPPRNVEVVNPIDNNMPAWLSTEAELHKYHYGDTSSKVFEGNQEWIPGPEYNKRMNLPDDMSAEDYPDIHKLAILAHLQPYSNKIPRLVRSLRSEDLTDRERAYVDEMEKQVNTIKKPDWFDEHRFLNNNEIGDYSGTVEEFGPKGIKFKEYPNKYFGLAGLDNSVGGISDYLVHKGVSPKEAASQAVSYREAAYGDMMNTFRTGKSIKFRAQIGSPEGVESPGIVVENEDGNYNAALADRYNLPIVNNGPMASQLYNAPTQAMGRVLEPLVHDLPVPIASKFMGANTPIEAYEKERVYGSKIKLWEKPWEHWLKPMLWNPVRRVADSPVNAKVLGTPSAEATVLDDMAVNGTAAGIGDKKLPPSPLLPPSFYEGKGELAQVDSTSNIKDMPIPGTAQQRRDTQEYFDKLEYIKNVKLSNQAMRAGSMKEAVAFMKKNQSTMLGVNPLNLPMFRVSRVLPKSEQAYFEAFANEADADERKRALSLIPDYEKPLLMGQWMRNNTAFNPADKNSAATKYAMSKGWIPDPSNPEAGFQSKEKEVRKFFEEHSEFGIPDDGWVGWQSGADLTDILAQHIQTTSQDIHDYDIWEDRMRMLDRKPYLEGSNKALFQNRDSASKGSILNEVFHPYTKKKVFPGGSDTISLTSKVDSDTIVPEDGLKDALVRSLPKSRKDGFDSVDFYMDNKAQHYTNRHQMGEQD